MTEVPIIEKSRPQYHDAKVRKLISKKLQKLPRASALLKKSTITDVFLFSEIFRTAFE